MTLEEMEKLTISKPDSTENGYLYWLTHGENVMKTKTEKTSHTPGPWKVGETRLYSGDTGDPIDILIRDATLMPVASIFVPHQPAKANARLIAAAPELLAACKALQMEAAARGCGLRIADEAIAKAEGEANHASKTLAEKAV